MSSCRSNSTVQQHPQKLQSQPQTKTSATTSDSESLAGSSSMPISGFRTTKYQMERLTKADEVPNQTMTSVEDFNTPEKSTGTRRPATSFIVMSSNCNAESKKLKLDQLGELKDKTTSETSGTLYFRSDMSSNWQKMNDQEYSSSGKKTTSFSNSKTQQRIQISK